MNHLRRSSSESSISSSSTSSLTSTTSDAQRCRKRVTPRQLETLKRMFEAKSHPSKEARVVIANELGMSYKAVTIWYQNKRQTTKRNMKVAKENMAPHRTTQAKPSLDCIAELHEIPYQYSETCTPPRRTYSRPSPIGRTMSLPILPNTPSPGIWDRMLSSPQGPPPSPGLDKARFVVLPARSKSMRSLEWACAKARTSKTQHETLDSPAIIIPRPRRQPTTVNFDSEDTDTDVDEAITPTTSPTIAILNEGMKRVEVVPRSEDMEAALVLLGFMRR